MGIEAGNIQITEFNKECLPKVMEIMEDLFCKYGVSMPYFLLDWDFPDYSERPDWVTGYQWNLDWGQWGAYFIPWFNELFNILFDEAGLNKYALPDLGDWNLDFLNTWISELYESATRFGRNIMGSQVGGFTALVAAVGCKFESKKAGTLTSIKAYLRNASVSESVDATCAIYDASGNLLTNGTTNSQTLAASTIGWQTFNFSSEVTVSTSTTYWLAVFLDHDATNMRFFYDTGDTNQSAGMTYSEGDPIPDPFSADFPGNAVVSIYATYEE